MVYTAESDPLCYPGTTVLRNLLDLEDQSELDEFEVAMFVIRSEEPWPEGNLDYDYYRALHRHLFQDVYAWAGETRAVRIGKGGNCYPEYINQEMGRIFAELASQAYLVGLAPDFFQSNPRTSLRRSMLSILSAKEMAVLNYHSSLFWLKIRAYRSTRMC